MEEKPQFQYGLICDDVRHEVGDKFSLIGVYGSHLYVAQLPFLFPKLSTAISYRNVNGGDRFSIGLYDSSGQTVGEPIGGEVPKAVSGSAGFMIFGVFPPLYLEQAGVYRLSILINDDEATRGEIELVVRAADSRVVH